MPDKMTEEHGARRDAPPPGRHQSKWPAAFDRNKWPTSIGYSADIIGIRTHAFKQLSQGWNAEPNAPAPVARMDGSDLVLRFFVNSFEFKQFEEEDLDVLRFYDCFRYRFGPTNDEGWYRGQCRYSRSAPAWGEFCELTGDDPEVAQPIDLVTIRPQQKWRLATLASAATRHSTS